MAHVSIEEGEIYPQKESELSLVRTRSLHEQEVATRGEERSTALVGVPDDGPIAEEQVTQVCM